MSVISLIQAIVRDELQRLHIGDLGGDLVFPHSDNGDRDNYACNVLLKNSGLELRQVPVATPTIGAAAIPNVEDLCSSPCRKGCQPTIIVGRLYNDQQRPPLNQPNEIVHYLPLSAADDAALKLAIRSGGDHDPKRQVEVQMGSKLHIQLTDGDPPVNLETDQSSSR